MTDCIVVSGIWLFVVSVITMCGSGYIAYEDIIDNLTYSNTTRFIITVLIVIPAFGVIYSAKYILPLLPCVSAV